MTGSRERRKSRFKVKRQRRSSFEVEVRDRNRKESYKRDRSGQDPNRATGIAKHKKDKGREVGTMLMSCGVKRSPRDTRTRGLGAAQMR